MKILITGCSGMLGSDLCNVLSEHEIYGVDVLEPTFHISHFTFHKLDVTDFEKTYKTITKINPEIVIHTAAWTDVDGAEKNQDDAYKLNVLGTKNIALACQRFDASMVYISTDYVFDGEKKEPYIEFDKTNPQSVYGKSKYAGEIIVQQLLNKFFIIRTSWLYGENGKNFVKTILNNCSPRLQSGVSPPDQTSRAGVANKKKELKIVNDQFGSPTYTKDLAGAIKTLLTASATADSSFTGLYGIYHVTNSKSCSWYEFAKRILQIAPLNDPPVGGVGQGLKIIPVSTNEFKRPAKRPKNSVLENLMWKMSGFKPLRDWDEALTDYLKDNPDTRG